MESFPCRLPEGVRQNVFNLGVSKRYLIDQNDLSSKQKTALGESQLADLCCEACRKVLERAGRSFENVGYLITTYDATPFLSPGLSQLLIPRLGFNPYVKYANAQGIASTAFPKALELAENHLALHPDDFVLICVSGVSSYWFQNQLRNTRSVAEIGEINKMKDADRRQLELRKWIATMQFFLFGDGVAAAIVARKGKGFAVRKTVEVTNLRKEDYLAGYARLEALNEPFRFGFCSYLDKEIPRLGAEYTSLALDRLLGKDFGAITRSARKWAVHTGSEKILTLLAERNGIEPEKLAESREVLKECGNLAGASLPFILERITSGCRFSKGYNILMLGYGWGFSAAATLLEF